MNDENVTGIDEVYKVAVIGDGVGKTSIIQRFTSDTFSQNTMTTIGVETKKKDINKGNRRTVQIQITDTPSDVQFSVIVKKMLKDVQGAILVFDLTNKKSFDDLSNWITFTREANVKCMVLVGNKCDIKNNS